ncbi:hypothetical protein C8J57DRAFT_185943 [Mycena rebaudengoi]|nr:hypothetical protein C8J57DRAFT_185943 [Mycena rebaudengoi]
MWHVPALSSLFLIIRIPTICLRDDRCCDRAADRAPGTVTFFFLTHVIWQYKILRPHGTQDNKVQIDRRRSLRCLCSFVGVQEYFGENTGTYRP